MALLVQKYGGSSLIDADAIRRVAKRVIEIQDRGNQVVVVVSAMGNTTDELVTLARQVSGSLEPRELDLLLSTGELVSCTLLAMAIRCGGHSAISLTGGQAGIITDSRYGRAKIASVRPQRILDELVAGRIVVVAGFQGMTGEMDITTLGRGASDTTAVALAASLGAELCEVYTDVEGIYTADPNLVPGARKLDSIGFEEMLELASLGSKMHPRSIEIGMVYGVPILVSSAFAPESGTLIHQGVDMDVRVGELRNRVRGIATDTNVAKVTVMGLEDCPGSAADLFEPLASADISVDVIVQNASVDGSTDISFTVGRIDLEKTIEEIKCVAEEVGGRLVVGSNKLAKVSIVGTGMQDSPGYASRMFRALADAKINIDMIATSEIRITCIVDEACVREAAHVLHSAFELDLPG